MIYTINNISNKFKLKQLGSIDALLFNTIESVINSSKDRVLRCSNSEIFYVGGLCKTAVNNFMKAIVDVYMTDYANKKVIMSSSELLEDGSKRSSISVTSDVETLSQEYTSKFFGMPPYQDLINHIAKVRGISANELRTTLTILVDKQSIREVNIFYQSLFYLYFLDNVEGEEKTVESVKSLNFIASMEEIYKKGNSANKNIIYIKKIMDKWLTEGSMTYRSSNRGATLNEFKKGIYYYFIFLAASNK